MQISPVPRGKDLTHGVREADVAAHHSGMMLPEENASDPKLHLNKAEDFWKNIPWI